MLDLTLGTPEDADALTTTVLEGFASYRAFAPPGWAAPDRIELGLGIAIGLRDRHQRLWVARDEGAVAGHAGYVPAARSRKPSDEPGLAHVNQVFVRRAYWGSGAATQLLHAALADAREQGFTAVRLFTPAGQARARRFYEREGFALVGEPLEGEPVGLTLVEYRRPLGRAGSGSRATP